MDGKGNLWDIDVLLQVKETHLQFVHLLLNRGNQFVPFSASGEGGKGGKWGIEREEGEGRGEREESEERERWGSGEEREGKGESGEERGKAGECVRERKGEGNAQGYFTVCICTCSFTAQDILPAIHTSI